jgi:hypothetical protein
MREALIFVAFYRARRTGFKRLNFSMAEYDLAVAQSGGKRLSRVHRFRNCGKPLTMRQPSP